MMTMLDAWLVHAAGRAECTSVLCNKFAAARDARGCGLRGPPASVLHALRRRDARAALVHVS